MKSLSNKVGLILSLIILFYALVAIVILGISSYQSQITTTKEKSLLETHKIAKEISLAMNKPILAAKAVADTLANSRSMNLNRADAIRMIENVLYGQESFLGFRIAFEPNAFDGKDEQYSNTSVYDASGRFMIHLIKHEKDRKTGEMVTVRKSLKNYQNTSGRIWYQQPKLERAGFIYGPVLQTFEDKEIPTLTFLYPVLNHGKFLGVLGIDYSIEFLQNFVSKRDFFEKQYTISIFSKEGKIAAHSGDSSLILKTLQDLYPQDYHEQIKKIREGKTIVKNETDDLEIYVPLRADDVLNFWQIRMAIPYAPIKAKIRKSLIVQIVIAFLLTILSVFIVAYYIARQLQPLKDVSRSASEISQGNLVYRDKEHKSSDEIGVLHHAFHNMKEKLKTIVEGIHRSSDSVVVSSKNLRETGTHLSSAASEQAASFEEMAATVEEVSSIIKSNAKNLQKVNNETSNMSKEILGAEEISQMTLKSIEEVHAKIKEITSIASQTNILALNTGIEAARAGAYGKSFSVVALEIRQLADKSKSLAEDISKLIQHSVEMSQNSDAKLQSVIVVVKNVVALLEENGERLGNQQQATQQLTDGIRSLTDITQSNAAISEELAASAEELESYSFQLKEQVAFFKLEE